MSEGRCIVLFSLSDCCCFVSFSLSVPYQCPSETEDTDDGAVDCDWLTEQTLDDVDGRCVCGLTGLYNHGNTCYVNATIQALSNWYESLCRLFPGKTLTVCSIEQLSDRSCTSLVLLLV